MKNIAFEKLLTEKLAAANYSFSNSIIHKLVEYISLLDRWNQTYNLTSVRNPENMITRHILDSLAIKPYLQGKFILDVGTGAGLPGIPLALTNPDCEFYLLDSNGKKIRFVTQAISTLQLTNVQVIQSRVENFTPEICFDTIVSRAFSSIAEFLKLTQHLCCKDGCWLAMKGEYPSAELAELSKEYLVNVYDLKIPGLDAKRHIVKITN